MSWSARRAVLLLAAVAALAALSAVDNLHGQVAVKRRAAVQIPPVGGPGGMPGRPGGPGVKGGPPPKDVARDLGNLVLLKDDDLKERLDFVEDSIKLRNWDRACEALQALVGRPDDKWVARQRRDANGQLQTVYVSVKKEADRIIGTLPEEGLKAYRAMYQARANTAVKAAKTNDDYVAMVSVASLYRHTAEGAEAINWIGTYLLNRGDFRGAIRWYRDLVDRSDLKKIDDKVLVKAALAFHQSTDRADQNRKERLFKAMVARKTELKVGDETLDAEDIRKEIEDVDNRLAANRTSDVRMVGAGPDRSSLQRGGTPFLEPLWKQKTVLTPATGEWVSRAEKAMRDRNQPVFTAYQPITATVMQGESSRPWVLYRSHWGVHAVDMKTGKFVWDSRSDWSNDVVLGATDREKSPEKINAYTTWLSYFLQTSAKPQLMFENSVLGTLSSDGRYAYMIDDFPVPPPAHMTQTANPNFGGQAQYNWSKEIAQAFNYNKLYVLDLQREGKVVWGLGGSDEKAVLNNSFFLGPPLPVNGKVYVLVERQQEIVLVELDPETQKVTSQQMLATIKNARLSQDPLRRVQATHMAYADGVLVIPTNAGAVFGVDLFSKTLLWAYPYAEQNQGKTPPPWGGWGQPPAGWLVVGGQLVPVNNEFNWIVTPPAMQDGKAVFTAPDGSSIHCVNVADGSRVWSAPRRQDDLYLAGVFNGKAVLVGKGRTRALSLARGVEQWVLETGLPSGIGAASVVPGGTDTLYYVPVREAVNTREPEICAINVDKGYIHAHTRSRSRKVPGNLIFFEGNVISQDATEIAAFPQLEIKLAKMNADIADKPDDPDLLVERGDYLLDKGDLGAAIADFRRALRSKKQADDATLAKARTKLYEAFTEHFQRDFAKAEEYLKEYEQVCSLDTRGLTGAALTDAQAETRRRRANFLCLIGKGREAQGRLVDAFEKYLELGEEARPDDLIQVVDEPAVRAAPDVWSQGRIAAMVRNASDGDQKKELEKRIVSRWNQLKSSKATPLKDLRKFVSLFASLFDAGKEARLTLAERLMDDTDVNSLLEAEQQLHLLRAEERPEVAARAVEALARLNTKKGMLEDAAYYYRLLGQKYPNVTVEGKKGADYLEELATDKRFLPYLDESARFALKGKVELKHEDRAGFNSPGTLHYQFAHSGESLPFFNRYKFSLQMDYYAHRFKMWESAVAEPKWSLDLERTMFQQIASTNGASRVKFSYQSVGHLVVVQLGHMVFGIDPLGKGRELWKKNLAPHASGVPSYQQLEYDAKDNSVRVVYADGWMQRLGAAGPMQAGVICLQSRDKLTAIDPVTGRTLWERGDIGSQSHLFGDDQHLYVVGLSNNLEPNGTRVFRAYDGVSVRVPDFSDVYKNRVRVIGKNILASDLDARGELTLRIYDVLAGKTVWSEKFAPGSMVMESEDARLAGVATPSTGEVRVIDVETRREVLKTKLEDRAHLDKATQVYLMSDPDYVYLAVNRPDIRGDIVQGSLQANFYFNSGLRSVPVNGHVYSWQRKSGELQWFRQMNSQHLVLSQFEDLPMLLFTARYQRMTMPNRWPQFQCYAVKAVAKHNGKLWYDFQSDENTNTSSSFFALTMDHRTGKVEFVGEQRRVTLMAEPK